MSYFSDKGNEKYKKYLLFGILNGVVALAMFATTIVSTVHGESVAVQVFGYSAGLMWSLVAFLMVRVYFVAKKTKEERLDDKDTTL